MMQSELLKLLSQPQHLRTTGEKARKRVEDIYDWSENN